ncbi:hypothetical protein BDF20DRAFT_329630 [Mycotypha africana]|uniref:uncharacterized protein n=1 Tax=Mycotypha africana TaxID=64632 RepID=UPI0022FFE73F|nr:uncharacterized protein BDF20DRAFT_329630 [Mycotypha africana]KAI8988400.1 hypothetical protein BDF20DRAFT_329630 [Mycotypha africana]
MLDDNIHRRSHNSSSSSSSSHSTSNDEEEYGNQKNTLILCEKDYYQHSQLKCHQCNEAINNDDYVVLSAYKYHKNCLQCIGCTITKNNSRSNMASHENGNSNSSSSNRSGIETSLHEAVGLNQQRKQVMSTKEIYDYDGRPYCRYHFSLIKGIECAGCGQTILHHNKGREGGPKWHSECYMIQKYWHVRLIELEDSNDSQQGKLFIFT